MTIPKPQYTHTKPPSGAFAFSGASPHAPAIKMNFRPPGVLILHHRASAPVSTKPPLHFTPPQGAGEPGGAGRSHNGDRNGLEWTTAPPPVPKTPAKCPRIDFSSRERDSILFSRKPPENGHRRPSFAFVNWLTYHFQFFTYYLHLQSFVNSFTFTIYNPPTLSFVILVILQSRRSLALPRRF